MTSKVFIKEINGNFKDAILACFNNFGGVDAFTLGKVFIKINATMPNSTAITSPEVILTLIEVLQEASTKPKEIIVFDNTAVGFPTRVSFMVKNLEKQIKNTGARVLYLDEQRKTVEMDFQGKALDKPIPIPKILYDNLITHGSENTFINVPRLKTHLQTGISSCLKNLHGLLYDEDKLYNHHLVDYKVVELYQFFKPNINLVDANVVTNNGMAAFKKDWLIPMNLLLAGTDAVALDAVGAHLLGVKSVQHIEIASKQKLGVNDFSKISILPSKSVLEKHCQKLNDQYEKVPRDENINLKFFSGKSTEGCRAGCKTIMLYGALFSEIAKIKQCICIFGKGHNTKEFDTLKGPFIVAGSCAVEELYDYFEQRADRKDFEVFYLTDHFHMTNYSSVVLSACKVSMKDMAASLELPLHQIISGFIRAKIRRAKFISLF